MVFIAIQLPKLNASQRWLAAFVSEELEKQLGIPAYIEKLQIQNLDEIALENILVLDQHKDTLIYANKATANIDPTSLAKGKVYINTLAFAAPDIRLKRAAPDKELNIQFIIDSFYKEKQDESNTDLRINQLIVYDGKFKYDVMSEGSTEGKFDPNHIAIDSFACNISLKHFNKKNLNLYIRSIKGIEKSGIELKRLKARIKAEEDIMTLSNFNIELPGSSFSSDSIIIKNAGTLSSMAIDGELRCNNLSLNDFSPILPKAFCNLPVLSFDIRGHVDSTILAGDMTFEAKNHTLALECTANIVAPFDKSRKIDITFNRLNAKEKAIGRIVSFFKDAPEDITKKLGDTDIDGKLTISMDSITGHANIHSTNGSLNAALSADSKGRYNISAMGTAINLGNITGQEHFSTCNIQGSAEGNINTLTNFNIELSELQFKGYTYSPIKINGTAGKEFINATASTEDPNASAMLGLTYKHNRKGNKLDIHLAVDSFIPHNLNLKYKEPHTFSFTADGEYEHRDNGKSLTNIKIQNFCHNDGKEATNIQYFHLYDDNTEEKRSITINSDILNADIVGYFNTDNLIGSYIKLIDRHLPALNIHKSNSRVQNNYFYRVEILDTKLPGKLLDLPFAIKGKSRIWGSCYDSNGTASIEAELNGVTAGKSYYSSINLKGTSDKETFMVDASILKPNDNTLQRHSGNNENGLIINLHSTIASDSISSIADWSDLAGEYRNRGTLQMITKLDRDEKNKLCIENIIAPSSFTHDGSMWNITPGIIKGNSEEVTVNELKIYNKDQSIAIEGIAGKLIEDSLNIQLKNMDISTIMGLINFKAFLFDGRATGSAHLTSLLYSPYINGHFKIDSMSIDNALMGQSDLGISWMDYSKTITLDCDIHNNGTKSRVNGFLSPVHDTIMLKIDADRLNIGFLNNKVGAFLSDIDGYANGTAYIIGGWRRIDLAGSLALHCSTRVKANNVVYSFMGDTVRLNPGSIVLSDIGIKDRNGNRGRLTGKLNHNHFGNWTCDINADVRNMLVYDTQDFSVMPFYGSVYATGKANINSEGGGLTLKADLRNEANSIFVYNSTTASGASDNSFVTFTDSRKKRQRYTQFTGDDNKSTYDLVTSKLNLDFMLDITDAFHIKVFTDLRTGDYIDLYGNGTVYALYDEKDGFSMKGGLDLDRGTYKFTIQDVFPKEFDIQRGSTLAFDGDPFKAALDLRTKYLVRSASLNDLTPEASNKKTVKVNCLMNITGTLASPILNFDLELPEGSGEEKELLASVASTTEQKNMQFIYLLGIGKFYTQDYNDTNSDTESSTAMESLISNTLSGQLNNMLGQIINNDNWDISGNFSSSEKGWNRMEVEGMLRGRLLNNRLLINGNFGYRENPIANSNFMGDFELQWLLTPKGNINLKAYSKTNDRYFSKTNLTTQGAGILFKHDFDSWKWWKRKENDGREDVEKNGEEREKTDE